MIKKLLRLGAKLAITFTGLGFLLAISSENATAEEPAPADGVVDPHLAEAKRLFEEGKRLREQGQLASALTRFEASRAAYPSIANTKNVAVTQYRVGRYSQALSTYWELLARFGDKLEPQERKDIETTIRELEPLALEENAKRKVDPDAPAVKTEAPPVLAKPSPAKAPIATPHLLRVDLIGGFHIAPGFGATNAGSCANGSATLGGAVGARVGYSLHKFFTVEIGGGFLGLGTECQQQTSMPFGGPLSVPAAAAGIGEQSFSATYKISGATALNSGFFSAGASYRRPLSGPVFLLARSSVGVLRGSASNATRVAVSTGGAAPIDFPQSGGSTETPFTALLLLPEIGIEVHIAKVRVGINLGATIIPVTSGSFGSRTFAKPSEKICGANDLSAGEPWCAKDLSLSGSNVAPTVTASPSIALGYDF